MGVYSYKCPNCNGGLNFDPKDQNFTCEYCHSHFSKEEMEANKPQTASEEKGLETKQDQTIFYACPGCGAEVLTDGTTAATHCFYCHSSLVLADRLSGVFKPDAVIPFTIPKEQAIADFLTWMKKRWFVPKDFCSSRQLEKVTGVYFPAWYVDCDAQADLTATATKVRTWQDSQFRYTETRFYRVSRSGEVTLKNIPKKALSKVESELFESVLPFDESKAEPFTTAYLTGFQAEKRNIEAKELQEEVNTESGEYTKQLFNDTVTGYTTVSPSAYDVKKLNMHWKYTLLPVWALTYKEADNVYYYVMNGQTGKANGALPVDRIKLGLVSVGLSVLIFFILLLINRGGAGS